jgi:uncharacterized membrane protein
MIVTFFYFVKYLLCEMYYTMTMSKDRLETFSDGVFAIILTLLVLELHVPNIPDHASLVVYAAAMMPLLPKFISFVFSFFIVATHWIAHHYFFRNIRRTPLGLVLLNNLFLLWLCFMPFPTAMLGDHPTDQFPILLYAVNQLLAAFTFFAFRWYAQRNNLLEDTPVARAMGPKHSLPAISIFTISIIFAFVNVYLSLLCFLLVPLIYFIPNFISPRPKNE